MSIPARPSLRRALVVAATAATAITGLTTVAAQPVAALTSVTFSGGGYGHGIGLSQWGAYGYAVDHGWSAAQILDRFYGGTVASTVPEQDITVRLLLHDDRQTATVSDTGSLVVDGFAPAGPWRSVVVREVAGAYQVFARSDSMVCPSTSASLGAGSGWQQLAGSSASVTVRTATDTVAATSYGSLVSVCEPDGKVRSYRGVIRAVNGTQGENRTVNQVPLEHYLRSVVAGEMPWSWGNAGGGRGLQALMAQAVAARSYALAENRYSYARTCDLQVCQVYLGAAWRSSLGATFTPIEKTTTDTAIAGTSGQVRRVGTATGPIAYAMFSSSSGGQTAPSTLNFGSVADEGDSTTANPYHRWTTTISAATIQNAYPSVGTLTSVSVLARDGQGPWGGRVTSVRVVGSAGSVTVTGNSFRSALGLRSTLFTTGADSPPPPPPPSSGEGCGTRVPPPVVDLPGASPAARFTPVSPVRLVDTREGIGAPAGLVPAGCTLAVDPNVADGTTAVTVNIVAVDAVWDGFVTVYPCGEERPWTAIIQSTRGRTTGGASVVPLGGDGRFCVYTSAPVHLVIDLFGTYAPATGQRFSPITTARRLDTRSGALVPAGSVTRVKVAGVGAVPTGATAAAMTVHATSATAAGFVTVYPCSAARPWVASVNLAASGDSITNHVQVGLSPGGEVCLYNHVALHLTVDVSGWYGPDAEADYFAMTPVRAVDTREGIGLTGAFSAGANRPIQLAGTLGLPTLPALRAVVGVVTTTQSSGTGYVTVHPCLSPVPNVSMVRYVAGRNVATTVAADLDAGGRWCMLASASTHLVLDVNGYFAG